MVEWLSAVEERTNGNASLIELRAQQALINAKER